MNFSTPSFSKPDGNLLGNLKSKLGFGEDEQGARGGRSARSSRNDFDDFDDYEDDEYGYNDDFGYEDDFGDGSYEDEFGDYGPAYDNVDDYAPVNPVTTRRSSSRDKKGFPNLVSIDDVKAHTTVPERLKRDPLPERKVTSPRSSSVSSSSSGRIVVDDKLPDYRSGATTSAESSVPQGIYDPYEAYSSSAPTTHTPTRSITILRPNSYADVEQVAKIVKSGDVVVLSLANTSDALAKRILDFSFGVASALDASVETPGDKVFAIAKGAALSVPETQALHNQGVL